MDKLIMTFRVFVELNAISGVESIYGAARMIPFRAEVESPLFTGYTLPGACDVQTIGTGARWNLCAKYMFQGKDPDGMTCRLFVCNEGTAGTEPEKINHAVPHFITNSPRLSPYLSRNCFRSEVQSAGDFLEVRIYDTDA